MQQNPIVLFDGVCNLCIWSVQFIILRDPKGIFRFASLQSDVGRRLAESHGLGPDAIDTVILVDRGRVFTKSDAAIQIARRLTGLWPALAGLSIIPRSLRDWGYDVIARNRYRWFGKQATCLMPSPENLKRFRDAADGQQT